MVLTNLDLDALRTLAVAQDLGGFGRAAQQLGRTPSAISLQMKRLQEEVGVPLFRRFLPQAYRPVPVDQRKFPDIHPFSPSTNATSSCWLDEEDFLLHRGKEAQAVADRCPAKHWFCRCRRHSGSFPVPRSSSA